MAGKYSYSPFVDHLGFEIIEQSSNQLLLKLIIKDYHLNTNGALHGGVNATMLDVVLGMAITNLTGQKCITVNLNISYLRALTEGEEIFAVGRIINEGYKIVTAEGEIYT